MTNHLDKARYAARANGTPHFYVAPVKPSTDSEGRPTRVPVYDGVGEPPACRVCNRSKHHVVHLTPGAPWP